MQKDQDLADYLDMFSDNMKNRKIPQAAQARHLIPLLNVKATSAIAGLVEQLWQAEKKANEGVRATTLKMTRQARRLGKDAEQILDRLLVLQMYHPDVQKYVREKEPKDPTEASELVIRYFQLHGIDELKYVKNKPWTHKTRAEKRSRFPRESPNHMASGMVIRTTGGDTSRTGPMSHQDAEGNSSNSTEGAKATQSNGSSGSQLSNSNSYGTSHEGAGVETRT